MLDKKSMKTLVSYIEKAILKRLSDWGFNYGYYKYTYKSDFFDEPVYVTLRIHYNISKGKISIIKQDNKIYFCVEKLLVASFNENSFRSSFVREIMDCLYYKRTSEKFFARGERRIMAERIYDLWVEQGGGIERFKKLLNEKKRYFIRGDFEIPCKGLDPKIIPIASLDLDDFKLRYISAKSSENGSKVAVSDITLDSYYWSKPDFLRGLWLGYDSFRMSSDDGTPFDIVDDSSLDSIVEKVFNEMVAASGN